MYEDSSSIQIHFFLAKKFTDLEKGPRLEECLSQGLIKVKVKPVVGVYVVSDPGNMILKCW